MRTKIFRNSCSLGFALSLLFVACTPPPPGSTTTTPGLNRQTEKPIKLAGSPNTDHNNPLPVERPLFRFIAPLGWAMVSDPSDIESNALEFYHSELNMRLEIRAIPLEVGMDAQIVERAQQELHLLETGSTSNKWSHLEARNLGKLSGMGWEHAAKQEGRIVQSVGMVSQSGETVFLLILHAEDAEFAREELLQIWQKTLEGFAPVHVLAQSGPALSPKPLQTHYSLHLGYRWNSPDPLWHRWYTIEQHNSDLDLALTDTSESVSFFVLGAQLSPEEATAQEVLNAMLQRLGVSTTSPSFQLRRKGKGNEQQLDFELIHVVGEFDFWYTGRLHWNHGRALLSVSWTQQVLRNRFKETMHRAIDAIKLEDVPKSPSPRLVQWNAKLLNHLGLRHLMDKQPLVALAFFERANRTDPGEPLYLVNCGFVYQLKNLHGPGIRHFTSQISLVERSGKLMAILGEMYEAQGDYSNARIWYEKALRFYPHDRELTINLSDALWGLGQRTRSVEVVQKLFERKPSARLGVYVAKSLMGMDQYAEAADFLKSLTEKFSLDRDMGLTHIDILVYLKRYQESLTVVEQLLRKGINDGSVWAARGRVLFYLRRFQAAEVALVRAIQLGPGDEDPKGYLSATRAFLGKSDPRALQTPIEPVSIRPTNLSSVVDEELRRKAKEQGFSAVIHWREEVVRSDGSNPWVSTEQMLVEILDSLGPALFAELTYTFLPGYDRIHVNALEVLDQQLRTKERWNLRRAYISSTRTEGSSADAHTAHLPVENLASGDFLFVQVSRTTNERVVNVPFSHFIASHNLPVGKTTFRLLADTARIFFEEYGPLERRALPQGLEWSITHPVVLRTEPFMPLYRDFGAGVMVAQRQTWAQVGRDYQNLIRHQFRQAVPVREKAAEIRGSLMADRETLFRIVDWVRSHIRYRKVDFGGHSLIPLTSVETMNSRMGDCKDQSLLLKELLQAQGFPAHLALIHLEEVGTAALPTIHQFNHMIVHVPAGEHGSELWIDPTDKSGARRPVPLDLEGRVALIIDKDSSWVTVTPVLEKDQEHQAHLHHQVFIADNGSAQFRDSLVLHGKFAAAMRNEFLARDEKERSQYIREFLAHTLPDAELITLTTQNLDDFRASFTMVLAYSSKNCFVPGATGISGKLPNHWTRSFLRLPRVRKRHHPLRLPHETHIHYSLHIRSAPGTTLQVEAATTPPDFQYLEFQSTPKRSTVNQFVMEAKWKTYAIYADASEYETIRKEWLYLLGLTSPVLQLGN